MGDSYTDGRLTEDDGDSRTRIHTTEQPDARAKLDAALTERDRIWAEDDPAQALRDPLHALTANRAAVLDAVEQLCSGLYEGVHPLEDGDEVQYVGVYVLKWGKVDTPEIGFRLVDARRLVRGKDGDGARR